MRRTWRVNDLVAEFCLPQMNGLPRHRISSHMRSPFLSPTNLLPMENGKDHLCRNMNRDLNIHVLI